MKKRKREVEELLILCDFRSKGGSIYRGKVRSETEWEKTTLHNF